MVQGVRLIDVAENDPLRYIDPLGLMGRVPDHSKRIFVEKAAEDAVLGPITPHRVHSG